MEDYLILLQAKLDEAKSKKNIKTDIDKLQKQLNKLKIQVEFDPKAAQKLADNIGKLLNQNIVVSNIKVDANSSVAAGQKDAKRKFIDEHDLISKKDIANAEKLSGVHEIQLLIDNGETESKIDALIAKTNQWTDVNGNARISTQSLTSSLDDLVLASNEYIKTPTNENQRKLMEANEKLSSEYNKVTSEVRSMNAEFAKDSAVDTLRQKYQNFYNDNGKAHNVFGNQLKSAMEELARGAEVPKQRLEILKREFVDTKNECTLLGLTGKTWLQNIGEKIKSLTTYLSSTGIISKVIPAVKDGISIVKELDTALVDLKKTTKMTANELVGFYLSANDTAKQTGITTKEIIEQAATWARLGFSTADAATKMAKYSSMFAMISPGMDLDSATDGLASVMKAFKIGLEDTDDVVDGIMSKINIIGNTQAVNNADIIDFLRHSSSAMAEANNSLEDTIALGTAITEITRDAADAGQVLKTVSMRVRGYDENTEEFIGGVEELSRKIADLTKTASTPGGISLFTDSTKTQFKSTRQLLQDISEIYDQLSNKTQAKLLEALTGNRNEQAVAAILNDFDTVTSFLESMANSAGSAEAEMSIAMDSIDFKLNKIKETGTGIAQNLFGREDIKTILDGIGSIGNALDWLTDKLDLSGIAGIISGIFMSKKGAGERTMFQW